MSNINGYGPSENITVGYCLAHRQFLTPEMEGDSYIDVTLVKDGSSPRHDYDNVRCAAYNAEVDAYRKDRDEDDETWMTEVPTCDHLWCAVTAQTQVMEMVTIQRVGELYATVPTVPATI